MTSKKMYRLFYVVMFFIALILFIYKDLIFQEGNPIPLLKGIINLNDDVTYVKVNNNPVTYITKTNNQIDLFTYIEKENNVIFKEQMGSSYLFMSDKKSILITSRHYTRYYQIWKYQKI